MNPREFHELQEKALSLLQPLVLDAYEMVLTKRAKKDIPKDNRFHSHFNGDPYFEPGEEWPMVLVKEQEQPYDFIFQIVNDGTFGLPENIAMLQLYYNWDLNPWDTESKGWLVKTYGKIDRENGITIATPIVRKEDLEKRIENIAILRLNRRVYCLAGRPLTIMFPKRSQSQKFVRSLKI